MSKLIKLSPVFVLALFGALSGCAEPGGGAEQDDVESDADPSDTGEESVGEAASAISYGTCTPSTDGCHKWAISAALTGCVGTPLTVVRERVTGNDFEVPVGIPTSVYSPHGVAKITRTCTMGYGYGTHAVLEILPGGVKKHTWNGTTYVQAANGIYAHPNYQGDNLNTPYGNGWPNPDLDCAAPFGETLAGMHPTSGSSSPTSLHPTLHNNVWINIAGAGHQGCGGMGVVFRKYTAPYATVTVTWAGFAQYTGQ